MDTIVGFLWKRVQRALACIPWGASPFVRATAGPLQELEFGGEILVYKMAH